MNFQIFYFSGTGNTWWSVREFVKIAQKMGHKAEYHSIEGNLVSQLGFISGKIKEADAVGFAYPVYASMLPPIMKKFIDSLGNKELNPLVDKLDVKNMEKIGFTITTMAFFSGDCALLPKKSMKRAGLSLKGAINIFMSSNLSVPWFRYNPVSEKKLEKRKIRGRRKLKKLVDRLTAGGNFNEGRNPLLILGGMLQRAGGEAELKLFSKFSVDESSCSKCLLCLENCPTDNIILVNDKIQFNESCTTCMRCYNFCPSHSVMIFGKKTDPAKYIRNRGPGEGFKLKFLKK